MPKNTKGHFVPFSVRIFYPDTWQTMDQCEIDEALAGLRMQQELEQARNATLETEVCRRSRERLDAALKRRNNEENYRVFKNAIAPDNNLALIYIPCELAPAEVYEKIVDDLMQQDEPTRLFLWVLYKRLNEKFGFTVAESPRMIRELSRGHTSVT